jgi:hypothetical protein
LFTRWQEVFRSFWIAIGWGSIRPDGWVYWLLFILVLFSLAGLGLLFVRRCRGSERSSNTVFLVAILLLYILVAAVVLELWMRRVLAPHGRLMFPALAAIAVSAVFGWRQVNIRFSYVVLGLLAIITIALPLWVIRPAFTPPKLLSVEEVANLTPRMDWQYGESAGAPVSRSIFIPCRWQNS